MTELAPNTPNIISLLWLRLKTHPLALVSMLLLTVISAFTAIKVYDHLVTDNRHKAIAQATQTQVEIQKAKINSYLNYQHKKLKEIAENPDVITAMSTLDEEVINQLESKLRQHQDPSHRIYLLTSDDQKLEITDNFVAREMASRAFTGESVSPEGVRLKTGWRVIFAATLRNADAKIIGVAISSLSNQGLLKTLQAEGIHGKTELYQQLPGLSGNTVISTGQKNPSFDTAEQVTQLPYWSVRFTGNDKLLGSGEKLSGDVKVILISLAITILLIFYLCFRYILTRYQHEPQHEPKKSQQELEPLAEEQDIENTESFLQAIPSGTSAQAEEPQDERAGKNKGVTSIADTKTDSATQQANEHHYPEAIFRDYDIRGIYGKQLDSHFAEQLGKCLGTMALTQGKPTLAMAWDGRLSSPELKEALEKGILATGCDVISVGQVPTPILNFALHQLSETSSGVMVTASHNLSADNGFKIFFDHHALCGDEITALRQAMIEGNFRQGAGRREEIDLSGDYIAAIAKDIVPAMSMKVVIDAGNGIAGKFAVKVLEEIGCNVVPLYCDVNGNFPHHPPDTAVKEYLRDLEEAVTATGAQLGICLDGDGDRMIALTATGRIVWPDELLMIFARDVLSRHPGSDIVYDIKCTRRLAPLIRGYGGRPVMWKTGHSHMRNKIKECNAPLGAEFSGHIFFHDRWKGFDDGTYAAARLIEIMMVREQPLDAIINAYEKSFATAEIKIIVPDDRKFEFVERMIQTSDFGDAQLSTLDGLRVDFPSSWGLVRASNTSPALTLRFEAESEQSLEKIQSLFRQQLSSIDTSLTF